MTDWILAHSSALRVAAFFGLLILFLVLERLFPRRGSDLQRHLRWPANLGLVVIDSALLLALPVAALATAFWAEGRGWGLLHALDSPAWLAVSLGWLLLDVAIYWQHRAFHEIRWLWPLHRVHHSDIEFDATTGLRFHPGEILLSMLYKCGLVLALGIPPLAVLLFEIALNGFAIFTHANLRLPPEPERWLRRVVVTPEMHRIHHSAWRVEHDSNYGNALSVWDRLFSSYTPAAREPQETMRIGLPRFRAEEEQRLLPLLRQPFAGL